jgi:hypothetical protein
MPSLEALDFMRFLVSAEGRRHRMAEVRDDDRPVLQVTFTFEIDQQGKQGRH